jgi:ATP-dependent helicase/nuclease subunit A
MLKIDPNLLQRQASNPKSSVWVNASAGSGKTKILTDRFLRILLEGTEPHKILCLTFTKAAAAEMAVRIQEKTKYWAICDDMALRTQLANLTGVSASVEQQQLARTLFARILDVIGGLRIQTIHSFCQSILRRFPLESNVSPHFQAIDERDAREIFEMIFDQFFRLQHEAKLSADLSASLYFLTSEMGEDRLLSLSEEVLFNREKFHFLDQKPSLDALEKQLCAQFSLDASLSNTDFENGFLDRARAVLKRLASCVAFFETGSETDKGKAELLASLTEKEAIDESDLPAYLAIFLTQKGEIRKAIFTKKLLKQDEALDAFLLKEADYAYAHLQEKKKRTIVKESAHFLCFAKALIEAYKAEKDQKGVLDYDDLIIKAAHLLSQSDMVEWVLYKLDGGIDHLLVDEAQDTSIAQWKVIKALVEDFYAGQSARDELRTLFVVGDEKQSIFSFQGADPYLFVQINHFFERQAEAVKHRWENIKLQLSFRSTGTILSFVDEVFRRDETKKGVSLTGEELQHMPFREDKTGHIEVWPLIKAADDEEETDNQQSWVMPVQQKWQMPAERILAEEIAEHIAKRLQSSALIPSRKRGILPGDIMILLRRRSRLLIDLVRALKKRGVPITGVDRLTLNAQMIVKDLLAVIEWCLRPEDDLTLAVILKSPLIGFSEDDLYDLCADRPSFLIENLQNQFPENRLLSLNRLRYKAQKLSPFAFLADVIEHPCPADHRSGRRAFFKRMGVEIEDAMNELLSVSLTYEAQHSPVLQNFVHWMKSADYQVKREMEQIEDRVRIMTVHGSKGLQAPIVYLPDTMPSSPKGKAVFYDEDDNKLPLFLSSSEKTCEEVVALKDLHRAKEQEEYRRLLYVALTRAEDDLIIAGIEGKRALREKGLVSLLL